DAGVLATRLPHALLALAASGSSFGLLVLAACVGGNGTPASGGAAVPCDAAQGCTGTSNSPDTGAPGNADSGVVPRDCPGSQASADAAVSTPNFGSVTVTSPGATSTSPGQYGVIASFARSSGDTNRPIITTEGPCFLQDSTITADAGGSFTFVGAG